MIAIVTQGYGATTVVTQGYGGATVPVPTPVSTTQPAPMSTAVGADGGFLVTPDYYGSSSGEIILPAPSAERWVEAEETVGWRTGARVRRGSTRSVGDRWALGTGASMRSEAAVSVGIEVSSRVTGAAIHVEAYPTASPSLCRRESGAGVRRTRDARRRREEELLLM